MPSTASNRLLEYVTSLHPFCGKSQTVAFQFLKSDTFFTGQRMTLVDDSRQPMVEQHLTFNVGLLFRGLESQYEVYLMPLQHVNQFGH